jgi:hypothetical protein
MKESNVRLLPGSMVDKSFAKICHNLRSGETSYRMYCLAKD